MPYSKTPAPPQWRLKLRAGIGLVWLLSIGLVVAGMVEAGMRGSSVLAPAGMVLFGVCLVAWVLTRLILVKPVPDDERPPEMRGPVPDGFQWGGWYHNARDPRPVAFDAKGDPILNMGHPNNRALLSMRLGALVLAIAMVLAAAVAWLLE